MTALACLPFGGLTDVQINAVSDLFAASQLKLSNETLRVYGEIAASFGEEFEGAGPATGMRFRVAESLSACGILDRCDEQLRDRHGRDCGTGITFRRSCQ